MIQWLLLVSSQLSHEYYFYICFTFCFCDHNFREDWFLIDNVLFCVFLLSDWSYAFLENVPQQQSIGEEWSMHNICCLPASMPNGEHSSQDSWHMCQVSIFLHPSNSAFLNQIFFFSTAHNRTMIPADVWMTWYCSLLP
jgi:hypothetical protein